MGFEAIANPAESIGNQQISREGAAKASAAVCPPVPADADLTEVIEGWLVLPQALRMGILSIVRGVVERVAACRE